MSLVAPGGYWPLQTLINLLRERGVARRRPWSAVVSDCLRDFREVGDDRIDLRLYVSLSPRPTLRCCPDGISLTNLLPQVMDRLEDLLKHHELELLPALLRTLSLIALTREAETVRSMPSELVWRLLDQIERGEELLKASSRDDRVVALVCLPYVRLVLRPRDQGMVELATLIPLLRNNIKQVDNFICAGLREYEFVGSGALRYQRDRQTPALPFFHGDWPLHTLAVLCSVQGILSYLLAQSLYIHQEYSAIDAFKVLTQARDFQGRCWRAFRTLRRHFHHNYGDLEKDLDLIRLEANALAQLAQFERILGRHSVALRFAIGSISKLESTGGFSGAPAEAMRFRSVMRYLEWQGINVPRLKMPRDRRPLVNDESEDAPRLALLVASIDPKIENAIRLLGEKGYAPVGWGVITCEYVRTEEDEPTLRAEAFKLALRMGALDVARQFFHLSPLEERNPNAETIKRCRTATVRQLGPEGVFNYANGVAAVSQSGVHSLDDQAQNRLKAGLRKILREFGSPRRFGAAGQLFLNHAQIGLGYHAKRVHRGQYAGLVDDADAKTELIDKMLEAMDRNSFRPVSLGSFQGARFKINDDEVMVSLMTDDGGTLKLTIIASNGRGKPNLPAAAAIDQDWNKLLKTFAEAAQSQIELYSLHPHPAMGVPIIEIPGQLVRLCMKILDLALDINPEARRIMIHADPMWNVVPWQFILHKRLKGEISGLVEKLVRENRRKKGQRGFGNLAFWRVPGVQLPPAFNGSRSLAKREIAIDVSEPTFSDIKNQLIDGREGRPGDGLLSILAHGQIGDGKYASFKVNGETVDHATRAKYGEYSLVLLHVCHAAQVPRLSLADDTMGVPGEIIQGGAKVVIAPGSPLPTNLINKIEACFYDLERGDNLQDIEQRYLRACVENPEIGMYTLYSAAIAPAIESYEGSK